MPALLLTENLPLRTTRALGDFSEDLPLPHRYGDLRKARFKLIKITDTRWFAADHPMTVTEVFIGDVTTIAYQVKLNSDDKGNTWTEVILNSAAPPNTDVTATGLGKVNKLTGRLIENPAAIIEDIAALAGRSESWPQLKAEAAAEGVRLAGSIETVGAIKTYYDDVCASAGAAWCPGYNRLYPIDVDTSGYIKTLTRKQATNLSTPTGALQDTADILRLSYDADYKKPQNYIELTASPQRFGGVTLELQLGWIRSSVVAEAIGRRILKRLAGERYSFTFDCTDTTVRPGDWVQLIDNPQWQYTEDPYAMVLGVEITPNTNTVLCTCEVIRSDPTIILTAHSLALPDTTGPSLSVAYVNGVATFTILDDQGQAMFGARVSFDGSLAKKTDERGSVAFDATRGTHNLRVEATGFQSQDLIITI